MASTAGGKGSGGGESSSTAPAFRLAAASPSFVSIFGFERHNNNAKEASGASQQQPPLFTMSRPAARSDRPPSAAAGDVPSVSDISWSPDGRLLAAAAPHAISICDTQGIVVETVEPPRPDVQIRACSFGWRGQRHLYFGGSDGAAYVWDRKEGRVSSIVTAASGQNQSQKSASPVSCLALPGDDGKLAVGFASGAITIRSLKHATTATLSTPFKETVHQLAFYPFKKSIMAAVGDGGTVALWDLSHRSEPHVVKNNVHTAPIRDLTFPPCNKNFYCTVGLDNKLRFHDIQQTFSLNILPAFEANAPLLSVSINDDHNVAIGTAQGTIFIYDIRKRAVVHTMDTLTKKEIACLRFQPPKWAMDEALKEPPIVPKFSMPTAQPALTRNASKPALADKDLMDMFSPLSKGATKLAKSKSQNMIKSLAASKLVEQEAASKAPELKSGQDQHISQIDTSKSAAPHSVATSESNTTAATHATVLPIAHSPFIASAQAIVSGTSDPGQATQSYAFIKNHKSPSDAFQDASIDGELTEFSSAGAARAGGIYAMATKTPTPMLSAQRREDASAAVSAAATNAAVVDDMKASAESATMPNAQPVGTTKKVETAGHVPESGAIGKHEGLNDNPTATIASELALKSRAALATNRHEHTTTEPNGSSMKPYLDAIRERVSKVKSGTDLHSELVTAATTALTFTVSDAVLAVTASQSGASLPKKGTALDDASTTRVTASGSNMATSASMPAINRQHEFGGLVSVREEPGRNGPGRSSVEPHAASALVSVSPQAIRDIVEECLQEHHFQLRMDIQNMHLDLLRQFEIQKIEIAEAIRGAVNQGGMMTTTRMHDDGIPSMVSMPSTSALLSLSYAQKQHK